MPRQLGPMMRMPYCLAVSINSSCKFAPSAPTSLKPAVMMTTESMPFLPALLHGADDEFRRDDDDGQVDGPGDIQHRLVRFESLNLIGFRIDRIDVALEFGVDQVVHDVVADFAGFSGGADHGDRFGSEKMFKHGTCYLSRECCVIAMLSSKAVWQ